MKMLCWFRHNSIFFVLILCFFVSQNILAQPIVARAGNADASKILLDVSINQQKTDQVTLFLQTGSGKLLASKEDLEKWQVNLPNNLSSFLYRGKPYYFLDDLRAKYTVDHKNMAVNINLPGQLFNSHDIDFDEGSFLTPTRSPLGGFLNYDMMAQKADGNSGSTLLSGLFSAHVFNNFGLIASDFVVQRNSSTNGSSNNVNNNVDVNNSDYNKTVRLNSAWTVDDPSKMRSFIAGDSFSNTGMCGKSVDFGGIHWGTNFATQPHFITYPLPSTSGVATLPSAVDLYVNNALTSKKDVAAGPFDINAIPVVTGGGTLRVVTTDLLGRQQVISMPYYVSGSILKPGLHDYSFDAGFVRENYAVKSNDYGKFMVAAKDRVGLTDRLTSEWRVEAMSASQQTVGVGGSYLWSDIGVFDAATAVSNSTDRHFGELASLGFSRQTYGGISYGINGQLASAQFRQIGLQDDQLSPSFEGRVFVGIPMRKQGSLGLSYIQQNNRGSDTSDSHLASISYSRSLGKKWSLYVSTLANLKGESNKACFITLSRSFGERTFGNLSADLQKDNNQGGVQLTRSLPAGTGWGYDLNLQQGQVENYQATLRGQNGMGTYAATAAQQDGQRGYRLEANGAVAAAGGRPYLSRTINDSFAIVQVPGYKNVRVYSRNQVIGRTDGHGNVFVPDLLSYDNNPIRIEPNDLPLTARIDATEMNAIPYKKSGLVMKFPVEPYYGAMLRLIKPSGEAIPSGATITALENKHHESFPVAENGMAYVTGLHPGVNHLHADWDNESCQFVINYRETKEALPQLGDIICASR